jgi:hypothetical protein
MQPLIGRRGLAASRKTGRAFFSDDPGHGSIQPMFALKLAILLALAALCFIPPVLIAFGVGLELSGPTTVRGWAHQGLLSVWWGRLLVSAMWLGLGWLCYRSVYRRQSAA